MSRPTVADSHEIQVNKIKHETSASRIDSSLPPVQCAALQTSTHIIAYSFPVYKIKNYCRASKTVTR